MGNFKICAWKLKKQDNQITGLTKGKILQSPADSIYSRNRFELLNCETAENDENDHPYHKDPLLLVAIP